MRILHLLYESRGDFFGLGGVGTRAYEIYSRLRDRHDICLVCRKYPGAKDGIIEGLLHFYVGIESRIFTKTLLAYARGASRYVREQGHRFDLIIEDFSPAVPTLLFTYTARPLILQIQGHTGTEYFWKYDPFLSLPLYLYERWVPRLYRNFIFVSEASMARYALGGRKVTRVISNGISEELLRIESGESDYILYLGRIDIRSKGLDLLLDAFGELLKDHPEMRLVIAGDGRDREKFHRLYHRLPQSTRTRMELTGWVEGERKRSLLKDALLVVVPSRHETQGIVVLEAAAASTVSVVSDIDEFQPVVAAGAAVTFRRGDSTDLARQMKSLVNDPVKRRECGSRGRHFAARLVWDRIAAEFEEFAEEVKAHGPPSRR